jgi:hypothetical protein
MNKIEKAIYDAKLHLKESEINLRLLKREIETIKNGLETLEIINQDKSIPNELKEPIKK